MSIQLVPDGNYLDIVATFRKLELSFWWVVNMLEMGELLRWAARNAEPRREPRRITFFAAIAEWKTQPDAAFVTELDAMPLDRLSALVWRAEAGHADARQELVQLFRDKIDKSNDVNLDHSGLTRLASLIRGAAAVRTAGDSEGRSVLSVRLLEQVEAALSATQTAEEDINRRVLSLQRAREHLERAIGEIANSG